MKRSTLMLIYILCSVFVPAWAEEEAPVEAEVDEDGVAIAAPKAIYIPLKPQFVVNYTGAGKLRYLKTGVTVRLSSADAASAIRHHMPFIRNNLVMLFAAQTDETLESQDGREAMRASALAEVQEVLAREEGLAPENVVDVLFNTLTWH